MGSDELKIVRVSNGFVIYGPPVVAGTLARARDVMAVASGPADLAAQVEEWAAGGAAGADVDPPNTSAGDEKDTSGDDNQEGEPS